MAQHYHPELRVVVNGQPVSIPANIGVDPSTGAMSALHTHTPDGVVHVEAARVGQRFTLGQFFTQWGVKLTRTQIGGLHADEGERVSVTVNGEPYTGNPAALRLAPDQKITLEIG